MHTQSICCLIFLVLCISFSLYTMSVSQAVDILYPKKSENIVNYVFYCLPYFFFFMEISDVIGLVYNMSK